MSSSASRPECRRPALTCNGMNQADAVEPVDAALQALLAVTAEHTADGEKSDLIYDFILTCSPVNEWPADSRDRLAETCNYVIGLARSFRGL